MQRIIFCTIIIILLVFKTVKTEENITYDFGYVEVEALAIVEPKDVINQQSFGALMLKQVAKKAQQKSLLTSEALLDLKQVRVQTLSVDSVEMRMDKISQYLDAMGWETTVRSWKKRERVSVFLQTEDEAIIGLFAMVNDRRACTLTWINVVGIVQPHLMGHIGRELEIDVFERVARLLPGYEVPTSKLAHNHFRSRKAHTVPISNIWDTEHEDLLVRYNRADGLFLGWRLPLKYRSSYGVAHYGEIGFGFGSKKWDYQGGAEVFTFYGQSKANLLALGLEVHGITDTQDDWRVAEVENSVYALLMRRDLRDYYRREGGSVYASHDFDRVVQVIGKVAIDHYNSLINTTDWSLFGNRWGGLAYFRSNPAIDEGQMRSVQGTVRLDTRSNSHKAYRGWFTTLSGEKAGGLLQGKYNFERYQLDVRRYQPLFNDTRLDVRMRFGTGRGILPRQFQYAIGGSGSVHGYDYKAIQGDRLVLFNIAYWVDGERHFGSDWPLDGVSAGAFFDAGASWFAQDVTNLFDGVKSLDHIVKRSAGVAFALEDFHVYFARPLDSVDSSWRVWVRFSRAF